MNKCLPDADCVNKKFAKLEEWDKGQMEQRKVGVNHVKKK